jgi:transmembrane sensor
VSDQHNICALQDEGLAWVDRMTSGSATQDDAAALAQWRNKSSAHSAALRQAILLRQACQELAHEHASQAAARVVRRKPKIARGALLGVGFAIFAGAAAWAAVEPPLGLWPSLAEVSADYRTGKGEQRKLALTDETSLQMNTLTSVSEDNDASGPGVDLVEGEVALTRSPAAQKPFTLHVHGITIASRSGTINVRADSPVVAITAVDTDANITVGGREILLPARHQIRIEGADVSEPAAMDVAPVLAWRQDLILLRDMSLAAAVREINRYRPGLIVIGNSALAARRINAVLPLQDISQSVDLICRLTGAHTTAIGMYVILT